MGITYIEVNFTDPFKPVSPFSFYGELEKAAKEKGLVVLLLRPKRDGTGYVAHCAEPNDKEAINMVRKFYPEPKEGENDKGKL